MKLLDRYEFTNGKLFETYLLERADTARYDVPECDVIGLRRVGDDNDLMSVMRPDEALIQARLLIDAVYQVTEGYAVSEVTVRLSDGNKRELECPQCHSFGCFNGTACAFCQHKVPDDQNKPLSLDLVDDLEGVDHAAE